MPDDRETNIVTCTPQSLEHVEHHRVAFVGHDGADHQMNARVAPVLQFTWAACRPHARISVDAEREMAEPKCLIAPSLEFVLLALGEKALGGGFRNAHDPIRNSPNKAEIAQEVLLRIAAVELGHVQRQDVMNDSVDLDTLSLCVEPDLSIRIDGKVPQFGNKNDVAIFEPR
jgi:hypothetical protein